MKAVRVSVRRLIIVLNWQVWGTFNDSQVAGVVLKTYGRLSHLEQYPDIEEIPYPKVNILSFLLRNHPDRALVEFLVTGFLHGFRLGYYGDCLSSLTRNNASAVDN